MLRGVRRVALPSGRICSQPRANFLLLLELKLVLTLRIWLLGVWQSSAAACSAGGCGDVSFSAYLDIVFSASFRAMLLENSRCRSLSFSLDFL